MLRTRQTAQMIASRYPGLRVRISQKLNEVYSPFDGCTQQALMSRGRDEPFRYPEPASITTLTFEGQELQALSCTYREP
jgi:hypothetical protein